MKAGVENLLNKIRTKLPVKHWGLEFKILEFLLCRNSNLGCICKR
jgi:hypothetical protein